MEPGVVGAGVGRFILAMYSLKSPAIGFVGLAHQPLRQNAAREQCNNYSELLYLSVNTRHALSGFAVARSGARTSFVTWPNFANQFQPIF